MGAFRAFALRLTIRVFYHAAVWCPLRASCRGDDPRVRSAARNQKYRATGQPKMPNLLVSAAGDSGRLPTGSIIRVAGREALLPPQSRRDHRNPPRDSSTLDRSWRRPSCLHQAGPSRGDQDCEGRPRPLHRNTRSFAVATDAPDQADISEPEVEHPLHEPRRPDRQGSGGIAIVSPRSGSARGSPC